jgi:DNA-binding XRE family transcriptional regulator
MDKGKPQSLAQRLQGIGIKKSHAYMIARGDRTPSLPLALKIHDALGLKLGPLADASRAEIKALERVAERSAQA